GSIKGDLLGRAAFSYQWSVVCGQLSFVSYQLSVIGYRLSVIGYRLSVVSSQLSVLSCQLHRAGVDGNHWVADPERSDHAHGVFCDQCQLFDCTRATASGARNSEALVELIKEKAAARLVGLKPLAVDDELRDGPLAYSAHQFV